jgi:hypothetical protein
LSHFLFRMRQLLNLHLNFCSVPFCALLVLFFLRPSRALGSRFQFGFSVCFITATALTGRRLSRRPRRASWLVSIGGNHDQTDV